MPEKRGEMLKYLVVWLMMLTWTLGAASVYAAKPSPVSIALPEPTPTMPEKGVTEPTYPIVLGSGETGRSEAQSGLSGDSSEGGNDELEEDFIHASGEVERVAGTRVLATQGTSGICQEGLSRSAPREGCLARSVLWPGAVYPNSEEITTACFKVSESVPLFCVPDSTVQWGAEALAVGECESHWKPEAVSRTGDWGVMQLNRRWQEARVNRMGYVWEEVLDPAINLTVAWAIYQEQSWRPWSCGPQAGGAVVAESGEW